MKMFKKTNAQFAIEFIVLLSFLFIIFLGVTAVITSKVLEAKEADRQQMGEDIATLAQNEIELAKSASNGYSRTFSLPIKVEGNTYGIKILANREIVVTYIDKEHILFLPENVQGTINPGTNTIRKYLGVVYVNS